MSNASTIRRQVSGTQQLTIAPLVNPGTSQTAFTLNNNGLTGTGGGVIPLSAGVTGLYAGTGQVLVIRAAGTATGFTADSTTLILELFEVPAAIIAAGGLTATSFTGYNEVFATSALDLSLTAGQTTSSFRVEARIQLDAAGNLSGEYEGWINGTVVAQATISVLNGLVGEADLNFVLAATLSASTSATILTLNEFAIDLE